MRCHDLCATIKTKKDRVVGRGERDTLMFIYSLAYAHEKEEFIFENLNVNDACNGFWKSTLSFLKVKGQDMKRRKTNVRWYFGDVAFSTEADYRAK
jgi:hypothetical protein